MAMSPYLSGINFPGYSNDYQGAWQGSRDLSQSLASSGVGLYNQASGSLFGPGGGWSQMPGQYANLSAAVIGGLRGANRTNIHDIQDKYSQLSGQTTQGLINSGLGNSTVQQSALVGIAGRESREVTASRNSFANLLAGYQAQIGQAGLQAQQNALAAQQSFAGTGLGFLSGINVGYPDRGSYQSASSQGSSGGLSVGYGRPTGGYGPQGAAFGPQPTPVDYGPSGGSFAGSYGNSGLAGGPQYAGGSEGGGMWGPLYAAVQSAGQAGGYAGGYIGTGEES
jgi:hypothetical protein